MKILNILIILFFINSYCTRELKQNYNNKEQISNVVVEILSLAKNKDIVKLNKKYIHPKFGLFEIHRIGLNDKITRWEKIEISTSALGTVYQVITNIKNNDLTKKLTEYDVKYNCNNFEWDKKGLFFSNEVKYPKLSSDFEDKSTITLEKNTVEIINKNSIRVVLTEEDIIFYLTKIEGDFYITVIDRVTTDCSA